MTNSELETAVRHFVRESPHNRIAEEDAFEPRLVGMRIHDEPLIGFASAQDPLFTEEFKRSGIIHPEYKAPEEWLADARTVISIFFPFTQEVKRSNRSKRDEPYEGGISQRCSTEWLHARIEGQLFLNEATDFVQQILLAQGSRVVCPSSSKDFV